MARRSPRTATTKDVQKGDCDEQSDCCCDVAVACRNDKNDATTTAAWPLQESSWDEFTQDCASWCNAPEEKQSTLTLPTVYDMIQKHLSRFLESYSQKDDFVRNIMVMQQKHQQSALLLSLDFYRTEIQMPKYTISVVLRQIQLQVALRLALWSWAGKVFVQEYANAAVVSQVTDDKNSRKKKKTKQLGDVLKRSPTDILLHDIVGFLQLAALRLGPETPFLHFVKQCINKEQNVSLSQLEQIWDSFELANPFLQEEDSDSTKDRKVLVLSPPPKRKLKSKELNLILPQPTKVEIPSSGIMTEQNEGILPVTNVSLTAPVLQKKQNSLLLGSKSRFVGSHFNTRLSNVGVLFHQVAVSVREKKRSLIIQQHPKKAKVSGVVSLMGQHQTSASKLSRQAVLGSLVRHAQIPSSCPRSQQITVPATPALKRRRITLDTAAAGSNPVVALETPHKMLPPTAAAASKTQQQQLVPDTPQQRQMLPPPPRRAGMALVVTTTTNASTEPIDRSRRMPPRASSLVVAEAFGSLQRRHDRRRKST